MKLEHQYQVVEQRIREKVMQCGRRIEDVTLIAVSKTFPVKDIKQIFEIGGKNFGESRVQEALQKIPLLPPDCNWHFIGTLQTNKVKKILSSFCLIHSVDTLALAQKINEISEELGSVTSILLQVNTSGEDSKHGLTGEEWMRHLETLNTFSHLRIEGLMTMAPHINDFEIIRHCFRKLYQLRAEWQNRMKNPGDFRHLSMGMSNDYLLAIEEGATLLRIGSAIFRD